MPRQRHQLGPQYLCDWQRGWVCQDVEQQAVGHESWRSRGSMNMSTLSWKKTELPVERAPYRALTRDTRSQTYSKRCTTGSWTARAPSKAGISLWWALGLGLCISLGEYHYYYFSVVSYSVISLSVSCQVALLACSVDAIAHVLYFLFSPPSYDDKLITLLFDL